jgi:IS30 family transposase
MAKILPSHQTDSIVLGTKIYFAHPYSCWERGLSDNTNGLIRQYLKNGDSLKGLILELRKRIENKLNARPTQGTWVRCSNQTLRQFDCLMH